MIVNVLFTLNELKKKDVFELFTFFSCFCLLQKIDD